MLVVKKPKTLDINYTSENHKQIHTILLLTVLRLLQDPGHESYSYLFQPIQASVRINHENRNTLTDAQGNCEMIFYLCP